MILTMSNEAGPVIDATVKIKHAGATLWGQCDNVKTTPPTDAVSLDCRKLFALLQT